MIYVYIDIDIDFTMFSWNNCKNNCFLLISHAPVLFHGTDLLTVDILCIFMEQFLCYRCTNGFNGILFISMEQFILISFSGASVLVHGSSGIDSTLQVTSLAQLILDHDCRTVRGYVKS